MDDLIAKESHEEVVLLIETRVHNRRVSMVHSRTTRATWTLAGSPGIRLSWDMQYPRQVPWLDLGSMKMQEHVGLHKLDSNVIVNLWVSWISRRRWKKGQWLCTNEGGQVPFTFSFISSEEINSISRISPHVCWIDQKIWSTYLKKSISMNERKQQMVSIDSGLNGKGMCGWKEEKELDERRRRRRIEGKKEIIGLRKSSALGKKQWMEQ